MELSIFNFVVVQHRKIPRGLTETHEADLYLHERAIKGLTGYVKYITRMMRFSPPGLDSWT